MKDRNKVYVVHILECIRSISEFTSGGKDEFFSDAKTQNAVIHQLQLLSESTKRLTSKIKDSHPDIPWGEIVGFRNKVIHDYLGVDLDEVWQVVEKDLPPLDKTVNEIAAELDIEI